MIGIIGNMNNMYFPLARYLADAGYDCELLLFDYEPAHFHPTADTFQKEFNFKIRKLEWGDPAHFFRRTKQAKKDLEKYSFLIGNGTAPAFVNRMGRTLDLFIPYGDDLYVWPFIPLVHPIRQIPFIGLAWHQRKGIQRCPYILFDKTSAGFEKVFQRLKYPGKRIISPPPLFYYKEYEKELWRHETTNPYFDVLNKLRKENDLLVLQHIRQFWRKYRDKWHMKGNDQLIKGFAQFIKNNPQVKTKLLLFEYGNDVKHTKKLIEKLGVEQHVLWFPKMQRKRLMLFIKMSDVIVGELYHSWNTYCIVHETLAMSKPLMHKRNNQDLNGAYKELYPMIHASSPESVCEGLMQVVQNKKEMSEIGTRGHEWFLNYCVAKPLEYIQQIIREKEIHA